MKKKSQASVIEVILLLAMGLVTIYYIYSFTEGIEERYKKTIYFYSEYIITQEVLNNYESMKILKENINAKNVSYKVYLPERLFGTTYYLRNRTINNQQFLIIYLVGSPYYFRVNYGFDKGFNYISGENEDYIN